MTKKSSNVSPVRSGTPVTGAEQSTKSTSKDNSSPLTLRALNDIYIIAEDPIELTQMDDSGLNADVVSALQSGKLIIPDAYGDFASKYPCRGIVVDRGEKCKLDVIPGDRVIYSRLGVQRYKLNGTSYCDVREADIHAIVEGNVQVS